jgi:hypothetical protein
MKTALATSVVAVALLACSANGAELTSGPKVGETIPGPFNPLHASGPNEGSKLCLV